MQFNSSWWKHVGDAISGVVTWRLCACIVNESYHVHTNLWDNVIFICAMNSNDWLRSVNKPDMKHETASASLNRVDLENAA